MDFSFLNTSCQHYVLRDIQYTFFIFCNIFHSFYLLQIHLWNLKMNCKQKKKNVNKMLIIIRIIKQFLRSENIII